MMHFGDTVVIDRFTVGIEKLAEARIPSFSIYLHVHSFTFTASNDRSTETSASASVSSLYLLMLHKNSLIGHHSYPGSSTILQFTARALVHTDMALLQNSVAESDKKGAGLPKSDDPPVSIALDFSGSSVKWFSYVCNGYLYSLSRQGSRLQSLSELRASPCITVGEDMELQLVQSRHSGSAGDPSPVRDVSDLISQLFLPRLRFAESLNIDNRYR